MASIAPWRCQFSTIDSSEAIDDSSEVGEDNMVERIEYSKFTASDSNPWSGVRRGEVEVEDEREMGLSGKVMVDFSGREVVMMADRDDGDLDDETCGKL